MTKEAGAADAPEGYVKCRVLKKGDGNISTGQHVAAEGDIMFTKGDEIDLLPEAADAYEDRGWVEIL